MGSEKTVAPASPGTQCPKCGAPLVTRRGSRGPFTGCSGYPTCAFTRSLPPAAPGGAAGRAPAQPAGPAPSGPAHNAITDLREAAGHIGRAIELLQRHHGELDHLVDQRDGVSF